MPSLLRAFACLPAIPRALVLAWTLVLGLALAPASSPAQPAQQAADVASGRNEVKAESKPADGKDPAAKPASGTAATTGSKPPETPRTDPEAPLPVSEIAPRADALASQLRSMKQEIRDQGAVGSARAEIGLVARDTDSLNLRTEQALRGPPTLDILRELDTAWTDIETRAEFIIRELAGRLAAITKVQSTVDRMTRQWEQTRTVVEQEVTPDEVLSVIDRAQGMLTDTRALGTQWRSELLALQSRAGDLSANAGDMRERIGRSQKWALSRLFQVDRAPLWSADSTFWQSDNLLRQSGESLGQRWQETINFLHLRQVEVTVVVLQFFLVVFLIWQLRTRLRHEMLDDAQLVGAAIAFERPVSVSALIALLTIAALFPTTPKLFQMIVAILAAWPSAQVIGGTVLPSFRPVVRVLVGLFLVDIMRQLMEGLPAQSAIVFLFEGTMVMAASAWFAARNEYVPLCCARHTVRAKHWLVMLARAVGLGAGASLILYVIGMTAFANLLLGALLEASYTAVVLYAFSRIAEGLLSALLRAWPFTISATVRNHRAMLAQRGHRLIVWSAVVLWILIVLDAVSLRRPAWELFSEVMSEETGNGPYTISLGGVFAFAVTLGSAWLASRVISLLLKEEVFSRIELPRGVPYAMTSFLHYVLMFFGTLAAVSSLGIELTKFTVLSGAFGVGLGLGLQHIVNNFVAGVIVLFERPVKIGDMIQIDDLHGRVDRIGIRSSVLRLGNGAEVILPNSRFTNERITNWTLTSRLRRIDANFTTEVGADPEVVRALMLEAVATVPGLSTRLEPQALLTKLGPETLEFSIQVWTEEAQRWQRQESDLLLEVHRRLKLAGIRPK